VGDRCNVREEMRAEFEMLRKAGTLRVVDLL
jgi:hypothetical protein